MRLGISLASFHVVDDPREGVRRMLERARAARAAGLDSLFVGDHHATPRPYYQNVPILGRLIGEWDARPCGALFLLPLWHPVLLAEQVGTLAAIAHGPFVLQCALGEADRQYEAMGVDPRHRPSRFEECLDALRRLWAGEELSSEGRVPFSRARISPVPAEPVKVWIGATAPPAIERAARLGDGWIASPHHPDAQATEQIDRYREACGRLGKAVGETVIRRDVYVGEDDAEAVATAGPVVEGGYRGFPEGATIIGGAERVAERLGAFAAMGYDEVLVRNLVPGAEAALASTERLGRVRELLAESH
ncbi:MAG TPA: LLM class flavin-dependent oxidoreductase [Thermoanaerobaculia bacterium]|nr:LLM class flavin-dependent oxidoreductase [Thermoanaerobaculia bacterium]